MKLADKYIQSDNEVCEAVKALVINNYFSDTKKSELSFSPLETNDFSVLFSIEAKKAFERKGIYVKFPKADLYKKFSKVIMPLCQDDRNLGKNEFESLKYLAENWKTFPLLSSFVKPLGYISEYNAIITERIYAEDIFRFFRKYDLLRKFCCRKSPDRIHDSLRHLAFNLAQYHKRNVSSGELAVEKILQKIEYYASRIKLFGGSLELLNSLQKKIAGLRNTNFRTDLTYTLKGLDIRNILVDAELKIFLLDPGKLKKDSKEADLARFIVTCRILYWGNMAFFLRLKPDSSYEEIIINSYDEHFQIQREILRLLIIKELVKHWYLAHIALDLKLWPLLLKNLLRMTYINPFYKNQIQMEVSKL